MGCECYSAAVLHEEWDGAAYVPNPPDGDGIYIASSHEEAWSLDPSLTGGGWGGSSKLRFTPVLSKLPLKATFDLVHAQTVSPFGTYTDVGETVAIDAETEYEIVPPTDHTTTMENLRFSFCPFHL